MKELLNMLYGGEIRWFKELEGAEKVKAVICMVLICVFCVMVSCDNAPWWWYGISVVVLAAIAVLANQLPTGKLEE